jgi:hypothetical protein
LVLGDNDEALAKESLKLANQRLHHSSVNDFDPREEEKVPSFQRRSSDHLHAETKQMKAKASEKKPTK